MNGDTLPLLPSRWRQAGEPLIRQYSRLVPVRDEQGTWAGPCLLKQPNGEDGLAFLQNELTILSQLAHPAIIPLVDSASGDRPYYVMPHAEQIGDDPAFLASIAAEPQRILALVRKIASALIYLHQKDIAHRDVCLGNLLISGDHIWLGDFGLALQRIQQGQAIMGERVFAADVAGLGKVLAGLVCGQSVEPVDFQIKLPDLSRLWGADKFKCLDALVQSMIAPASQRVSLDQAIAELDKLG